MGVSQNQGHLFWGSPITRMIVLGGWGPLFWESTILDIDQY